MSTVLDLATMLFLPVAYARAPAGTEDVRALAAHLRGIDNAFGVQAGINFATATSLDQANQYAALVRRSDTLNNLVLPATRVPLVFSSNLTPPFEFSRGFGGLGWGSSANSILVSDTGLWTWLLQINVSSTGSGVIWTFEFELPIGTVRAIAYKERVSVVAEPRTLSLVGIGRVQTLSTDDDRRIRCYISHDSLANQTLTVTDTYWQVGRRDS